MGSIPGSLPPIRVAEEAAGPGHRRPQPFTRACCRRWPGIVRVDLRESESLERENEGKTFNQEDV